MEKNLFRSKLHTGHAPRRCRRSDVHVATGDAPELVVAATHGQPFCPIEIDGSGVRLGSCQL
jgi:hypothetical protein